MTQHPTNHAVNLIINPTPLTQLVGILNLTPDSFSDGGQYTDAKSALAHMAAMITQGAGVIDVGAESTRPGAQALSFEEEWERLKTTLPELVSMAVDTGAKISLDTRHWQNAARGLSLGVDWINDVSGLTSADMRKLLLDSECGIVVMHSLGVPADPARCISEPPDVVTQLINEAMYTINSLESAGIDRSRLIYDPGIGFGKNDRQNLQIISSARSFKTLGISLLFGHSRKRFLRAMAEDRTEQRDVATLAFSAHLMAQGVEYLRVHEVGKHATMRSRFFDKSA